MKSATQASHASHLTAENSAEFWHYVWHNNRTHWKHSEKDQSIFVKNIIASEDALSKIPRENVASPSSSSSTTASTITRPSIFEEHRGMLVPLCGDTYATRFLTDGLLNCGCDTALKQVNPLMITCAGNPLGNEGGEERALFDHLSSSVALASKNESPLRFVMGVDLSEEAIRQNMKNNFPEISFAVLKPSDENNGDQMKGKASFIHYFARVMNPLAYASATKQQKDSTNVCSFPFVDIHFFVGDYFEVTDWWVAKVNANTVPKNTCTLSFLQDSVPSTSCSSSPTVSNVQIPYRFFDFSYDRASMIAIHPSLHQRYVNAILSLFGNELPQSQENEQNKNISIQTFKGFTSPRIFLEIAQRDEGKREMGPPFHIDEHKIAADLLDNSTETEQNYGVETFYGPAFKRIKLSFQELKEDGAPCSFIKNILFVPR